MKGKLKLLLAIGAIGIVVAGCANFSGKDELEMNSTQKTTESPSNSNQSGNIVLTKETQRVDGKEFTITAQASNLKVSNELTLPVWTFNNSVPGPEIRVKVGDTVKINLKNELEEPVSIHWHGYPVPNDMDGIPGVTQDAVVPGKTFTYEFEATVAGTYWYHSHQDSVNQLDKGLYGSLIVEDPNDSYDRDYTLVLDEWMSSGSMDMETNTNDSSQTNKSMEGMDHSKMNMGDMSGMDHSQMNMSDMEAMKGHDMSMYNLYTINGKTGGAIDKLVVKEGEKVRIRLINAGYLTHTMHLHGHEFKVVASDGQPVNSPAVITDQGIAIAPGERYDIEFTANNPGSWLFEEHGREDRVKNMRAVIAYEGSTVQTDESNASEQLPQFNLMKYGKQAETKFSLNQSFDQDVLLNLNTEMKDGEMVYTINGKVFPNTDSIKVDKGKKVKVTFVNQSKTDDHPMHLHGHFFQVLSKNGQPLDGAPVIKDTLNVKPGEKYVIAFEADNPGDWMFHCHDLHHASAGMVTDVKYNDYQSNYTPDPSVDNKPE
ncbi:MULTISPECIES: multicopper oxidase family protein [Brevibacillus]|uniref:multicopper oxidase family protein n=1 Tax=Brevibacillus TaxID=55080 RepID=UPI000B9B2A96|nr:MULTISPECIES: multicopper oxidase family protein [Brevibacillus]MBG9789135.1 copper oxidase [Brevibacillus laterosporus]MCG7317802.1 multicopper oxidase family protein [Brevibacillus laterosporus]MED1790296.1 multicopper oxidase family protein [Brevibacillus laterosporus]RFB32507.1 multicopper oxidase family protein [Brevibacillus sp. VP]